MKKTLVTLAIVLGMSVSAFAQQSGGGLFGLGQQRSYENQYEQNRDGDGLLALPGSHGSDEDTQAPLGTGAMLLIGFGAAYALKKRQK